METINHIVAEMRKLAREVYGYPVENSWRMLIEFADRIEKAVKALESDRDNWRKQALAEDERANATQAVTNCNGFKGRLALEQIRAALLLDSGCGPATALHLAVDKFTQEALAEPPRNCEVGTPREQAERFNDFCNSHYSLYNPEGVCSGCPLTRDGSTCEFEWLQMPYEKGDEE